MVVILDTQASHFATPILPRKSRERREKENQNNVTTRGDISPQQCGKIM